MNLGDHVGWEGAFFLELGIELLRPHCLHAAGAEGAADEWPVGFDEAEHSVDRDIAVQQAADDVELLEDSVDGPGAVARTDEHSFNARSEDSTLALELAGAPDTSLHR